MCEKMPFDVDLNQINNNEKWKKITNLSIVKMKKKKLTYKLKQY
jgi:hypothetical protein